VSVIVQDGITGWVIQPNELNTLTQSILRALQDPNRLETMGAAGRDRVRTLFSSQIMAKRYEQIYRSVLQKVKS
jgi:glycosyltransferase involved in cell wall biosynthesis